VKRATAIVASRHAVTASPAALARVTAGRIGIGPPSHIQGSLGNSLQPVAPLFCPPAVALQAQIWSYGQMRASAGIRVGACGRSRIASNDRCWIYRNGVTPLLLVICVVSTSRSFLALSPLQAPASSQARISAPTTPFALLQAARTTPEAQLAAKMVAVVYPTVPLALQC
jgi:hypothetical protein